MGNYKPPKGGKTGGKVEDGKPKRPQSAYFLFLADHRKDCKGKDIGHKDILRQGMAIVNFFFMNYISV